MHYVKGKFNVADAGPFSRGLLLWARCEWEFEYEKAHLTASGRIQLACAGETTACSCGTAIGKRTSPSAWMRRVGAPSTAVPLPFDDICGSDAIDLRSAPKVKTENYRAKKASLKASAASSLQNGKPEATQKSSKGFGSSPAHSSAISPAVPPLNRLQKEAIEVFESLPRRQFFFKGEPGALDLFSGTYGVAKQLIAFGAPWVLTYEWTEAQQRTCLKTCGR